MRPRTPPRPPSWCWPARQGALRRPDALAGCLHGTARRLALVCHRADVRRQLRETRGFREAATPSPADPLEELTARELVTILDEELQRLPDRYRLPLILCCLEGRTQDEAARQLGWTPGAVRGRLERGRAQLHRRLVRRGLALPAALLALEAARGAASASRPSVLSAASARAAVQFAAGMTDGGVADRVARLVEEGVKSTPPARVKVLVALVVLAGMGTAGVGMLVHRGLAGQQPAAQEAAEPKAEAEEVGQGRPPQEEPPARADRYGDPLPPGALARLGTIRFRVHAFPGRFALAPDGKTLAMGADGGVLLADVATGRGVRHLAGSKETSAVAFAPDGKTLASAERSRVRVWDLPTGRELTQLPAESGTHYPLTLLFAPDGKALATGGSDEATTRLWDLVTGGELWRRGGLTHRVEPMAPVAFLPDGKTLVVDENHGETIHLLDPATGKDLSTFKGPRKGSRFLLSPDGGTLAASTWDDEVIHLWDVRSGTERRQVPKPRSSRERFTFSRSGKVLAWAGSDKDIRLLDVGTGKELRRIAKGVGQIDWLQFLPADNTLAFCVWAERVVRFWDVNGDRELHPLGGHRGNLYSVAFAPDGRTLISASMDDTVRLWDPATGEGIRHFEAHRGGVWCMALAPDGKALATGSWNDTAIRLWDAAAGKELRRLEGHPAGIDHLAFSPDGTTLASVSNGHTPARDEHPLRLWDAATGKELRRLDGPPERAGPRPLAFSPDGKLLASKDDKVRLWEVATGRVYREFETPNENVTSLAFSPDGRTLACGGRVTVDDRPDGPVALWELATGQERLRVEGLPNWTECVAFSPDGRVLAAGGWKGTVRLWDLATGKMVRRLEGHLGIVETLAFSPDGRALASGGMDTTALVWDLADLPPNRRPQDVPAARDLEALWADLGGADAARAYRAVWSLAAVPEQAVPLLRERLRPAAAPERRQLDRLLVDLDSDQFDERAKAAAELEKLGELAKPALHRALQGQPSPELRRRVEGLLANLEGPVTAPEKRRRLRALEVLEQVGTPEARRLLQELSRGAPNARETKEAKASLERLTKRQAARP
jgi:WD40 repeat protein